MLVNLLFGFAFLFVSLPGLAEDLACSGVINANVVRAGDYELSTDQQALTYQGQGPVHLDGVETLYFAELLRSATMSPPLTVQFLKKANSEILNATAFWTVLKAKLVDGFPHYRDFDWYTTQGVCLESLMASEVIGDLRFYQHGSVSLIRNLKSDLMSEVPHFVMGLSRTLMRAAGQPVPERELLAQITNPRSVPMRVMIRRANEVMKKFTGHPHIFRKGKRKTYTYEPENWSPFVWEEPRNRHTLKFNFSDRIELDETHMQMIWDEEAIQLERNEFIILSNLLNHGEASSKMLIAGVQDAQHLNAKKVVETILKAIIGKVRKQADPTFDQIAMVPGMAEFYVWKDSLADSGDHAVIMRNLQ